MSPLPANEVLSGKVDRRDVLRFPAPSFATAKGVRITHRPKRDEWSTRVPMNSTVLLLSSPFITRISNLCHIQQVGRGSQFRSETGLHLWPPMFDCTAHQETRDVAGNIPVPTLLGNVQLLYATLRESDATRGSASGFNLSVCGLVARSRFQGV